MLYQKVAYIQSVVAVSAGGIPWLSQANEVVKLVAGVVAILVGCTALYNFYRGWHKN